MTKLFDTTFAAFYEAIVNDKKLDALDRDRVENILKLAFFAGAFTAVESIVFTKQNSIEDLDMVIQIMTAEINEFTGEPVVGAKIEGTVH